MAEHGNGRYTVLCPSCRRDLPLRVVKRSAGRVAVADDNMPLLTIWCRQCNGPVVLTPKDLHLGGSGAGMDDLLL